MEKIKNKKGKIKNRNIDYGILLILLFCTCLAAFYATAYASHLGWKEQNQIFLNSGEWVATYFDKPAWLGCLVGDRLTQLYANAWVGAIILAVAVTLSVAAFAALMARLLPKWGTWTLTALFAVLMAGCSLSAATDLSFFLCVAGGLALGLGRLRMNLKKDAGKDNPLDLCPLLVPLSFWLFGFGAVLTAVSIILLAIRRGAVRKFRGWWWSTAVCAALLCVTVPWFCRDAYALPYSKALLYPGLATPSMPQMQAEARMAVADAYSHRDYARAKRLALKMENPDDITAFYYYLASAMQDSLPDCLMKYPVKNLGTLTTIGEETPLMVINMMNDLYYELGDMTYAERAAMMRNVFSPRNRNVGMIKRLAEVNLVSGDTLAAMKYLRILDKTYAYRDWSREHTPGKMNAETEAEILARRAKSNSKDNIRLGDNCRNIILELLESNPHNTVALDYLLCTDLLLKDMDTFKMDYDTYCMEKGSPRYKDLYQQALMIWLAGTDASQEEWERYIVPGLQSERFRQYSNMRGSRAFADTYWYYFDTMNQ